MAMLPPCISTRIVGQVINSAEVALCSFEAIHHSHSPETNSPTTSQTISTLDFQAAVPFIYPPVASQSTSALLKVTLPKSPATTQDLKPPITCTHMYRLRTSEAQKPLLLPNIQEVAPSTLAVPRLSAIPTSPTTRCSLMLIFGNQLRMKLQD